LTVPVVNLAESRKKDTMEDVEDDFTRNFPTFRRSEQARDVLLSSIMPEISLTDFVDFAIKNGPAQFTKVKELAKRGEYDPRFDFWRPLREGIQAHHQDKAALDGIVKGLTDKKKQNRYPEAVEGYKKFLGKKLIHWFTPPKSNWKYGELVVRVNPELGLTIKGQKYAIKLYFKDEQPTKARLQVVFELMQSSLNLDGNIIPAVLDVAKRDLKTPTKPKGELSALLEAQAMSFAHMWNAFRPKD
jgi:hypothetical protein